MEEETERLSNLSKASQLVGCEAKEFTGSPIAISSFLNQQRAARGGISSSVSIHDAHINPSHDLPQYSQNIWETKRQK